MTTVASCLAKFGCKCTRYKSVHNKMGKTALHLVLYFLFDLTLASKRLAFPDNVQSTSPRAKQLMFITMDEQIRFARAAFCFTLLNQVTRFWPDFCQRSRCLIWWAVLMLRRTMECFRRSHFKIQVSLQAKCQASYFSRKNCFKQGCMPSPASREKTQ